MSVSFPHGPSGYTISDQRFLAAWDRWFAHFGPEGNRDPKSGGMPIANEGKGLEELLLKGKIFSLDVLCRMLVPYRNTMQATPVFRTENSHLLVEYLAKNPATGRFVSHVRISEHARGLFAALSAQDKDDVDALLSADIEDSGMGLIDVEAIEPEISLRTSLPTIAAVAEVTCQALIARFVGVVHVEPFQAHYRRKPVMTPSTGWAARLERYFWPRPGIDAKATEIRLRPMLTLAAELQASVMQDRAWTDAEEQSAVHLAESIFQWGGVPQAHVTAQKIRAVFESVNEGKQVRDAPMNSGWTKVAALASAACGPACEQVIWDSRVANSLLRRLDAILGASGIDVVPECLANLGRVSGRGGTRATATYRIKWPSGYRKWSAQFAGSAFVRGVRDELNRRPCIYPTGPANVGSVWTTREVEMVLFMDGY